eukprot:scaffold10997_cov119-Isochrysis_galbana.AAC.3
MDSSQYGTVTMFSKPFGWSCGCAATLWLLRERSPGVYRLTTPTHRGGVMCKALAGSGRCSGLQNSRLRLALRQY